MNIYRSEIKDNPYKIIAFSCPYVLEQFNKDGSKAGEPINSLDYFEEQLNLMYNKGYSLISQSIIRISDANTFLDKRCIKEHQLPGLEFIGTFLKMK